MSNAEEKAKEIKQFSKARALKWERVANQLSKIIAEMEENHIDYGTAWQEVSDAYVQAENNRRNHWADYYAAERIADGGKPALHNAK